MESKCFLILLYLVSEVLCIVLKYKLTDHYSPLLSYISHQALGAPYEMVKFVALTGKLPVALFASGSIDTPADAALVMQLGMDGVFLSNGECE